MRMPDPGENIVRTMGDPIIGGQEPGRNELCPCGSGLKYKHCHGDDKKRQVVQKFAAALMGQLIRRTKMEKGMIPWPFTCNVCGKGFIKPKQSVAVPGSPICPYCDGGVAKNGPAESQAEPSIIIGGNS